LIFKSFTGILRPMKLLRTAMLQAIIVVTAGVVVAFAHNAFSVNGINPFRKVVDVPVVEEPTETGGAGIRIANLEAMIEASGRGANIIDARTRSEYETGHIPGAILLDYYDMGRYLDRVLPMLDPEKETIVYCYGPDCDDAELLARELYALGFTNLLVYRGGFEEWEGSGRMIEEGAAE
jgi:rhodanese-related sulfurtransferase